MPPLTQSSFPGLYWAFQYWAGGTVAKRRLCLRYYARHRRVLEIGCSVGNIAAAFQSLDCEYVGLDIDPVVIAYARRRFARVPRMRFICADLLTWEPAPPQFDYILLAGVCHHIEAHLLQALIQRVQGLLQPGGDLVVVDPVLPGQTSWLMRFYLGLERGHFVRPAQDLQALLGQWPALPLRDFRLYPVAATPWAWPTVAQFAVARLRASAS